MNEVKYLIEKYQVNYISFADDVLFTNEARATEFCMAISELNIFYCVQVRVTNVTEKILKMLKKSGCICVAYGFESHSQKILDSMKKYVTTAQIDRAVKLTYNAELDIQGNFIFGDPAETPQTARETLDWFDVNKKYHIYVTRIFTAPGAEIYEYAKEKGLIKNVVDFIKNKDYVVNLTSMTAAEYDSFAREIASYAYNPLKRVDYIPQPVLLVHDETEPRYSFTARCEHCNATSTYRNYVRKARLRYDRRYQFVRCLKCHRRYFVDIQQQFAVNKTVIANRLKGNNIYVWGTGDYVEKVYGLFLNNLNISAFIDGWGRIDTYKGHRVIAAKDFIEDPKDCTDLLIAFSKPEIALERIYDFSVPKYNIVPLFESSINSELLDSYESYYNEVPKI